MPNPPSKLRRRLLSAEEQQECATIIAVRVPRSWHRLLTSDGSLTDKILPALAKHVCRLKKLATRTDVSD